MRVWLTGGTGFVGSNIVSVAAERGADVMTTVHSFRPTRRGAYLVDQVDMVDRNAVSSSVTRFDPDIVIHCAIMNDWDRMYADRRAAWDAYVTSTRATAQAAEDVGAAFILVSTDWVFDGTQGGADEETPPNPVNLYGVLKLASEMVAMEHGGAVARVSGVNGLHLARPSAPRAQDSGFGYFVASLVDEVAAGRPFVVWESDAINMRATPSLAAECASIMLDVGARQLDGVFHCCGADSVTRMELAMLTCEVFDLDPSLVSGGPPPPNVLAGAPMPYDSSLTAPRTSALLDRRPTPLRSLLEQFRGEYERRAA